MTLSLAVWLMATIGHGMLTYRAIGRTASGCDCTRDERIFMGVLAGVGTLSGILHILSVTVGISLVSGLVSLVAWHLVLAALLRRTGIAPAPAPTLTWIETAALAAFFAVLFSWMDFSAQANNVGGDAAHYHVPNAMNLALGGSLFDMPASPHLYPMAGSVIVAWFIVPVGTPLVSDLAMCLAFLLAAASLNWMFRLATGQSGLAWASWLSVLLFSAPIVRMASLVSADLWFTAAYLALFAVFLSTWTRRTWRGIDLALGALALGLLVGAKTTGVAAAVLLIGTYGVSELVRAVWTRQWPRLPRPLLPHLAGAALLVVAAGGIWLIRSWVLFGSPIAPAGLHVFGAQVFEGESLQPTTYLSVLGDIRNTAGYDVGARAMRYARLWLAWWFLRAMVPALLVPLDLAWALARRQFNELFASRILLLLLAVVPGVALIWLLAGAPWTSLEWTRGFSLRYIMPVVIVAALVSFVAIFPLSWRWYDEPVLATAASLALASVSLWLLSASMQEIGPRSAPVPRIDVLWIVPGVTAAWLCSRLARGHRRIRLSACVGVVALIALIWAPTTAARHERSLAESEARLTYERSVPAETLEPGRGLFLSALGADEAARRVCNIRRFFVLSRFDLPLLLDGPDFRSQVFYAGRDLEAAARVGAIGACDFVVSAPDMIETDKGKALLATLAGQTPLQEIPTAGPFRLFGRP